MRSGAPRRAASQSVVTNHRLGFDVRPVPLLDGVSSTRIRTLLRDGDVVGAAQLLGRPAELDGTVVLGDQRGGTLGYPTANLATPPELQPTFAMPAHGSLVLTGTATSNGTTVSFSKTFKF